jgi:hypothetical protein
MWHCDAKEPLMQKRFTGVIRLTQRTRFSDDSAYDMDGNFGIVSV